MKANSRFPEILALALVTSLTVFLSSCKSEEADRQPTALPQEASEPVCASYRRPVAAEARVPGLAEICSQARAAVEGEGCRCKTGFFHSAAGRCLKLKPTLDLGIPASSCFASLAEPGVGEAQVCVIGRHLQELIPSQARGSVQLPQGNHHASVHFIEEDALEPELLRQNEIRGFLRELTKPSELMEGINVGGPVEATRFYLLDSATTAGFNLDSLLRAPSVAALDTRLDLSGAGSPTLQILQKAYEQLVADFRATGSLQDSVQSRFAEGCIRACERSREIAVAGFGGRVLFERSMIGGATLRSQLRLVGASGVTKAQLILLPNLAPSWAIEHRFAESPESIVRTTLFYSRNGRLMHQSEGTQAVPASPRRTPLKPQVLVCENGFDPQAPRLVAGPDTRSSRLGWLSNTQGNFLLQWSGLARSMFNAGTVETASVEHARSVTETLNESGPVPFAGISIEDCMDQKARWGQNVLGAGIRIVNFSSGFSYAREACARSPMGRAIGEQDLLWVIASGNSGMNEHVSESALCPQNLGARENLIVVGAQNGSYGGLSAITSRGDEFVDLYADGRARGSMQEGASSLAAPRVSAAAARIHQLHPELPLARIRLALLLGARLPEMAGQLAFNPSRSGGVLDERQAMEIAPQLLFWDGKEAHLEEIAEEFYGRGEARLRIRRLLEKGALNESVCR